jgi:hypothetical protein
MPGQKVFLAEMARTGKRATKAIRGHPVHRVLWVQEAYRGNRDRRANKALLVLMESKDQEDKKAKRVNRDRKENRVQLVLWVQSAKKVLSGHRDHKAKRDQ